MPDERGDPDLPDQIPLRELESDVADTEEFWHEAGADIYPEQGDGP
jgi:hypothetical protein